MKLGLISGSVGIVIGMTGIASAAVQSDYTLVPPGDLFPPGVYAIDTSSNQNRGDGAWGNYTAPDGHSPFYEFNGSTSGPPYDRVFYWDANLVGGQTYSVSYLVVDNYPVAAPVLQLSDDGVLVGNSVTLTQPYGSNYPSGAGPWYEITLSFTPSSGGVGHLALVDTNTAYSGNDFSITGVPEPATWALMVLGFAGLGYAGYRGRRSPVAAAL
jgi:hypothetical protein